MLEPKRQAMQEDPLEEQKDALRRQINELTSALTTATGVDRYFKLSREKLARWKLAKLEYPNDLVQLGAARKALVDAEVRHERELEEDK